MNEVKWIKLSIEMFDNRKIKHLRKLPDGNSIVLIWVMLLTLAGKCNAGGMIFLTQNIPYTTKMLADELDFEENTVKLALEALESFGMISTDGFLSIVGWEEHQNEDALSAIRERDRAAKQRYREKQKQKQLSAGIVGATENKNGHVQEMSKDMSKDNEMDMSKDMSKDKGTDVSLDSSYSVSTSTFNSSSEEEEMGVQGEERGQEASEAKPVEKPAKKTTAKAKKKISGDLFEDFADGDEELLAALRDYERSRNSRKKPLTERSKTQLINKLRDKYPRHQWVAIVDQSTLRGWDSFYPLKNDEDWNANGRGGNSGGGNVFFENAREMVTNDSIRN